MIYILIYSCWFFFFFSRVTTVGPGNDDYQGKILSKTWIIPMLND